MYLAELRIRLWSYRFIGNSRFYLVNVFDCILYLSSPYSIEILQSGFSLFDGSRVERARTGEKLTVKTKELANSRKNFFG